MSYVSAWVSANTEGSYKRSAVLGLAIGWYGYYLDFIYFIMFLIFILFYFQGKFKRCGFFKRSKSNNGQSDDRKRISVARFIVSAKKYRGRDKPWYSLGHGIVLAYIAIGFLSSLIMRIVLSRENARRERGERDEAIGEPSMGPKDGPVYESVEAAKIEKGDQWSGFRYTL